MKSLFIYLKISLLTTAFLYCFALLPTLQPFDKCELLIRLYWHFTAENLFLYLSRHVLKHLTDICIVLGTDFEVENSKLFSHFLPLLVGHFPISSVALVPHKHLHYFLIGVGLYLLQPVLERLEGGQIIKREGHDDAHRSFVVSLSNCLEPLLPSRVPDLQSNLLILDLEGFDLEVDSQVMEEVPMVVRWEVRKLFQQNLSRIFVFPTPLSPIMSSFARQSQPRSLRISILTYQYRIKPSENNKSITPSSRSYCQTRDNIIHYKIMSIKDFTILAKLGQGAYSTVYKVQRLTDSQIYALKKVKLGNLSDKQAENALNEVRILASIRHKNIVSYKQAFLQGKSLCIIMEYADEGDLYHKIAEQKKKKKYFEENYIWKIVIHIIRGLRELHSLKILHRDIKSANVFLNTDGRAQLGDMNVSKIAENGLLYTQTGTPYYASPQVWSEQPYDSKSDIWSLGCVIYQMTTLEVPFKAEDMEGLAQTVLAGKYAPIPHTFSRELSQLVSNMLLLKPKNRPTCEKILSTPMILRKIDELGLNNQNSQRQMELMSTIRMPKKLQYLSQRLPKANYSYTQSYELSNQPLRKPRQQRERTNTLPKLEKVVRYHEEMINNRRKKQLSPNNHKSLSIQGLPKDINDIIQVRIPGRRDKLKQQLNRIYEGKHKVNKSVHSRETALSYI